MKFRNWVINISAFFGMGMFLALCWVGIARGGKWIIDFAVEHLTDYICYR